MDKRWKNLGLLVLIILVILGVYLFVFNSSSKSIDLGYTDLYNVFESNDVNIENVQNLQMVALIVEEGTELALSEDINIDTAQNMDLLNNNSIVAKVNWVESKENLLKVKEDLKTFKNNLSGYSTSDKSQLAAAVDIYSHAINYAFAEEARLNQTSKIFSEKNFSCGNTSSLIDLNNIAIESYNAAYNLAAEVDDFAYKYDPYSELVFVNLNDQYDSMISSNSFINETLAYCEGN
jgi:hypothetical protein